MDSIYHENRIQALANFGLLGPCSYIYFVYPLAGVCVLIALPVLPHLRAQSRHLGLLQLTRSFLG